MTYKQLLSGITPPGYKSLKTYVKPFMDQLKGDYTISIDAKKDVGNVVIELLLKAIINGTDSYKYAISMAISFKENICKVYQSYIDFPDIEVVTKDCKYDVFSDLEDLRISETILNDLDFKPLTRTTETLSRDQLLDMVGHWSYQTQVVTHLLQTNKKIQLAKDTFIEVPVFVYSSPCKYYSLTEPYVVVYRDMIKHEKTLMNRYEKCMILYTIMMDI